MGEPRNQLWRLDASLREEVVVIGDVEYILREATGEAATKYRNATLKNIEFREGNFLSDPIGSGYDLVFISHICHSFSEKENRFIIEKARDALNNGGKIAIQEFYIENNRTSPAPSALFSINMLVNTESGRCYSPQEIKGWLSEAGFGSVRDKRLQETVLVFGKKK